MPSRARSAVGPAYLLACLILGGSAQGVWQNALLQLAGLGILAWAAVAPAEEPIARSARLLLYLAIAALLIIVLQQVPLPPSLWASGARARIAGSYAALGRPVPWLPISLTPYESLTALLGLIPPAAMFVSVVRLRAYRQSWLAAALLAGTVAGIVLGAAQVASAPQLSWYPYAETNVGVGVGFFANANHMASLLVIGLPFIAALADAGRSRTVHGYSALLVVLAAVALLLIAGIALNGSLAGFALVVPVAAASALILLRSSGLWRRVAAAAMALSLVAAVLALATTGIGTRQLSQDAAGSVESRAVILRTTAKAVWDYMPLGSGLGSFVRVYRLYESPDAVTTEYVIHAHNDYAELTLELGAAGVLFILLFLMWWLSAAWAIWPGGQGSPFARAATIASAAVLVHSTVDFPLRTAAIGACFGMCLALMSDRRQQPRSERAELRPARHLVFA